MPPIPSQYRKRDSAPVAPAADWVFKELTIKVAGKEPFKVDGAERGGVGVHPSLDYDDLWAVTHMRTGLIMAYTKDAEQALRCGEMILEKVPQILPAPTRDDLVRRCPAWFKEWSTVSIRGRRYHNPEPYLEDAE